MSSSQEPGGGSVGAASQGDTSHAPLASSGDGATHQPAPQPPSAIDAAAASIGSTTVKWADQAVGAGADASSKLAEGLASGTKKLVGWETATQSQGLRPMHVRVAVRVHHVAFLHPGLDSGGRATIGDKSLKWRRFSKKARKSTPPGLLQFGAKKGSWKNPMAPKAPAGKLFKINEEGGNNGNVAKMRKELEGEDVKEASEISEIISAEAFRLSRDGIIQHHYALNHALQQQQNPPSDKRMSLGSASRLYPGSVRRLSGGKSQQTAPQGSPHSSMLSAYSAANPEEAARYYKECAERPKGYRRLVVSSAVPTSDVPIPPPPPTSMLSPKLGGSRAQSGGDLGASKRKSPMSAGGRPPRRTSTGSAGTFSGDGGEKDSKKGNAKDSKNDNLFDNVEYRYIGPPQTGPEFFQLLRTHGAATFGRYLPELACSVPNHSVGFELRKASKRRCASTQPLVIEAPHVIWGDARDKMLSKIAKEGCPLIDSRSFEYVSNAALDETELSESLMVCGATLWVQNADDDETSVSSMSTLKPHYTKGMVKAEYYGGKFVDGIKGGLKIGGKGLEKGTKGIVKGTKDAADAVEKGTKTAVGEVEKLLPVAESELETTPAAPTQGNEPRTRKRDKLKSMFSPKRTKNKFRKRSKEGDDGGAIDSSVGSVGNEDASVGGESIATDAAPATRTTKEAALDEKVGSESGQDAAATEGKQGKVEKTPEQDPEDEFTLMKPVPYVLLLDDVIDIRIVSFPDKNDVIATFPISVASVMVQRSMEDRTNDPLKPSELTATFIQEPSAPLLRWGVELKVTLRAVEVHPEIPRVLPRPKDVVDQEIRKMKDNLRLLGKNSDEAKKDLQAMEDEITKEENDLNEAIVAYGYGRGENQGAGMKEVRLRQMFYCEREHGAITRKMKRRTLLTEDEKKMLNDARVDPSSQRKSHTEADRQKLLELLDVAFPGIEEDDDTAGNAGSVKSETVVGVESDSSHLHDSLAKASLSLAKSLDCCSAGLTDKPTVPAVQKRLSKTVTEGIRPNVTRAVAKDWCSQIAEKLSTHVNNVSAADVNVKSSIAKLQSIVASSALGTHDEDGEEDAEATSEEAKLNEDEIADSQSNLGSSKLLDWATAVIIELEACAADLEEDPETPDSLDQEEEVKPASLPGSVRDGVGKDPPGIPPALSMESRQSSILSASSSAREHDPYEEVWQKILSQRGSEAGPVSNVTSSGQRIRNATSISSVKDALPRAKLAPKAHVINELLKMSKKGHSHQINMRTSSLSATLIYLAVVLTAFVVGAYGALLLFKEACGYYFSGTA